MAAQELGWNILKYFREVERGPYAFLVQITLHFMERGESHRSSSQNYFSVDGYAQIVLHMNRQIQNQTPTFSTFVMKQDA